MNKTLLYFQLVSSSIFLSCKEEQKVIEHWKGYEMVTVEQEPCLRFVHPAWVDEDSEDDWVFKRFYSNHHQLYSFIKNECGDTVKVALRKKYGPHHRLYLDHISFYWVDDYSNGGIGGSIFDLFEYYGSIPPGDSLYVSIYGLRDFYTCIVDSVRMSLIYKVGNKPVVFDRLKIDGKEIVEK
jgi:hypothetical protein